MSGTRQGAEPHEAPRPGDEAPAGTPGSEAPAGTPGSAENTCRHCGGSGRMPDGSACAVCEGTGLVTEEIGGG